MKHKKGKADRVPELPSSHQLHPFTPVRTAKLTTWQGADPGQRRESCAASCPHLRQGRDLSQAVPGGTVTRRGAAEQLPVRVAQPSEVELLLLHPLLVQLPQQAETGMKSSEVRHLLPPPWEAMVYETADPQPAAGGKCWSSERCGYGFSVLTPAPALPEELKDALEEACSGAKRDRPQQSRNRALPIGQKARGACE